MPTDPPSLPYPVCLIPPKGVSAVATTGVLTATTPVSNCSDALNAFSIEFVQTYPAKPQSCLFALLITSSKFLKVVIAVIGPKGSSVITVKLSLTLSIIVGS